MSRRLVVSTCLTATVSLAAGGQTQEGAAAGPPAITATEPAACTKAMNDWRAAELNAARAAVMSATTPDARSAANAKYAQRYNVVSSEARRGAAKCASAFNVKTIPAAQLNDLIALYGFAGDTAGARMATERAVSSTELSPRAHAQALSSVMAQEITKASGHFGMIDGAEQVMAKIDALPDESDDVKLAAHQRLMGQYEYLDVDEGLRRHATVVLALARKLGRTDQLASAYLSLARSAADLMHPDSALMILDQGEKEIGSTPAVAQMFGEFRTRYALIGTKAATVTGQWWLNSADKAAPVEPGHGTVTLVEFTAHWCMPCKNSYPGMRALAARFKGQPFQGVLVTSLYGYLGDQRNLTPEQEVAADVNYFTKEHELPYRVAINPPVKNADGRAVGQPKVDDDYRVGGIPQLIIIDKRGVIRQIVTGWDQGNTERFAALIQKLIAE